MSERGIRSIYSYRKGESARKFLSNSKKIRDAIASRSLDSTPGVIHDAVAGFQYEYRAELTNVTLQLLEQQIERELRYLSTENQRIYKEAFFDFEIRKHGLFNGLNEELALLRKGDTVTEASIETTMAEIQLRQTVIISQEALIKEKREVLMQQINQTELIPLAAELDLLKAQLAVATKRLEIIPAINQMIDAQKRLIILERGPMYEALQDLLDSRRQVAEEKQGLIPYMIERASVLTSYAQEQSRLIAPMISKAEASAKLASARYSFASGVASQTATAYVNYVATQFQLLPYHRSLYSAKTTVSEQELRNAEVMVERAKQESALAEAEYSVALKYEERAGLLISRIIPANVELVDAINKDVQYRKEAAEYRVKSANNDVENAKNLAKSYILSAQADVAKANVALAKIEYTIYERTEEAGYEVVIATNSKELAKESTAYYKLRSSNYDKVASEEVNYTKELGSTQNDGELSANKRVVEGEKLLAESQGEDEKNEIINCAEYSAAAEVTVNLAHVLSS